MNSSEPSIITASIVSSDPPHSEIIHAEIIEAEIVALHDFKPSKPATGIDHGCSSANTEPHTQNQKKNIAWKILTACGLIPLRIFQFASLLFLLAIGSTIPVLQLASLGYILEAGKRIAQHGSFLYGLPGLAKAGRIGTFLLCAFLTFLPAWLIRDFAITGQLIDPSSTSVRVLEVISWIMFGIWVANILWALGRGGLWWHFFWPQPIRFVLEAWRPSFWNQALDRLWREATSLQLPQVWWLGFRAFIGGLCWLALPATLMAIGLRGEDRTPIQALIGLLGGVLMMLVTMYLPFLQMNLAIDNRFRSVFELRKVRRQYAHAPWSFLVANFLTLSLAIPLYLLRIEATPEEYVWLLSLFFVLFSLPGRWFSGFAIYRSQRRDKKHRWYSRFPAYCIQWAYIPIYLGFLYLSLLVVWDGVASVFFQHAFLIPLPFQGT